MGRNDTVMMKAEEGAGRFDRGLDHDLQPAACGRPFEPLCAFSIMTMAASTIAPMAMAMPPRLMMLELSPKAYADIGDENAERQR